MAARPFDWRDLPALIRYRNRGLFLNKALVLTRGTILVPTGALFSYFAPAIGIFTYLCDDGCSPRQPLIGQVMHSSGASIGRLSFLAPKNELDAKGLSILLEYMFAQVGERGAMHLLAEVDEQDPIFEILRRNSFSIYTRQRIWRLVGDPSGEEKCNSWRAGSDLDLIPVRSLYNTLVPGLVQQVERPPTNHLNGLVYKEGDDLLAYIELKYGPRGIWLQPFVHPDAKDVADRLVNLLKNIPNRRSRPVYICIRSYQSWLETPIESLGAEASPLQSVMVKHLALAKKVTQSHVLRNLESGHPEASAPFMRSESKK